MEKNTVLSGNKLIAKFMGYRYIPFNNDEGLEAGWWKKDINKIRQTRQGILLKMGKSNFLCRRHHELRYWNSWDWLFTVIYRIKLLEGGMPLSYEYSIAFNKVLKLTLEESKENVFEEVVEFINWFNEDKHEWNSNK